MSNLTETLQRFVKINKEIRGKMMQDEAYIWSIDNQDAFNMMIVLSAWGFPCTLEDAIRHLEVIA